MGLGLSSRGPTNMATRIEQGIESTTQNCRTGPSTQEPRAENQATPFFPVLLLVSQQLRFERDREGDREEEGEEEG